MSSSFENGALYMILYARSAWNISLGNISSVFRMRLTNNIRKSRTIVFAYKLGCVFSEAALDQAFRAITDFGPISKRTGETFSCRTWMKDSLALLHDEGIAFDEAAPLEPAIESGTGDLTIMGGTT
ncbi:uncharacterized protein EAF01_005250 [Botrytis porri]|uniref:uncharacterized protein n=1 Tax=Botrytis porri TaxID=87229 RepID=UPI001900FED8|nr:uncharacterized protein EAF01_005250 [Botrytis porri]KAF7907664.1 hypothetical protein EAF01_005250 [Botrytis porri]